MDTITSRHGLAKLTSTSTADRAGSLSGDLQKELESLEKVFTIDAAKLKEISKRFGEELQEGLDQYGSNIPMNVTWVLGFPDGDETGEFLTIDLGGTNLRVCWIVLEGREKEKNIQQHEYKLPDDLKSGDAKQLWSFIADSLEQFIKDFELEGTKDEPLKLGFTFSYPAHQEYIDHGELQTWTKGFDIECVEGHDAAGQLRDALAKRDLPIELIALINDTTGAMIASAYNDPETIVGAIFGTGCNGAYMDDIGSIPKLDKSSFGDLDPATPMAINCEYGAFDNAHKVLPRTKYDVQVDEESPRPGEQAFEKMCAGLYLGETFRLVLVELAEKGTLFQGQGLEKLRTAYQLDTGFLSSIENDESADLDDVHSGFHSALDLDLSQEEATFVHYLAQIIGVRGARLCTVGVAAICRKKGITHGHVAADGSVANKHPSFKQRWAEALGEVLDWDAKRKEDPITITSAEDGSGIGAAVIAAMTIKRVKEGNRLGIKPR